MTSPNDIEHSCGAEERCGRDISSLEKQKDERAATGSGERPDWAILMGSFFIVFNTWGIINSYGAYQEYYSKALLSHESASSISWIGTIQGCFLDIVAVFIGPIYDRGYFRSLIYTGGFIIVFGVMMLSLCTAYWQLLLSQAICIGLGGGIAFLPNISVVTARFNKHRATAIGFINSASSIGGIVYPIMFRELQSKVGFGWATRIMGFIALGTFAVSFAAFGCYKVESKKPRALVDTQALREPAFMTYIVALSVIYAGFFVPYFYIPTYATQHLNTSSDLAFYLLAITNAGGFIGRLLPGVIPKILARPEVMLLATAGGGLLVLAWIAVRDIRGLVVFCLLYGIVSGAILTMTMVMVPALAPHGAVHETIGTRLGMSYFGQGIGIR
ncbi:hypothetical protein G7Y79_00006g018920 [Physcia stellaris]|nr:hypothetical protein G7Y79_00006g018920 [Physcia stellaris]